MGAAASGSSAWPASSITTRSKWPRFTPMLVSLPAVLSVATTIDLLSIFCSGIAANASSLSTQLLKRSTKSGTSRLARE
eukprot:5929938-Prymnesium_polylepis.1